MHFLRLKSDRFQSVFDNLKTYRLSVFLIMCFVLGGTSQDIVTPKLPLYLISLFVIGGCLSVMNASSEIWKLRTILLLWFVFLLTHVIFLIPFPPSIWSDLNGREVVVRGFEILGQELPWLPLSVTPEKTLFSLFDFLPPFAIIMLMGTVVTIREFRAALWSIGIFVVFSTILGMMQITSSTGDLHFYRVSNFDAAVGFFSNANHYGVFLLMSIPLVACLADYNRVHSRNTDRGAFALCMTAIMAALLGVGLSGSLAGYLLIIPVLAATLYFWTSTTRLKRVYFFGIVGSLIVALLFEMFVWNEIHSEISKQFSTLDSSARRTMFENSYAVSKDFLPFGSGPGSFSDVYRLTEQVGRKTIPHAHNEYIELIVEFGIFGLAGLCFTLLWLAQSIFNALRMNSTSYNVAKYMSITVLIVVFHSVFDYSLRTIAIMTLAVFAMCAMILSNKGSRIFER